MLEKESSFLVRIIRCISCSQQERRLCAQSSLKEYHSIREWMVSKLDFVFQGFIDLQTYFLIEDFSLGLVEISGNQNKSIHKLIDRYFIVHTLGRRLGQYQTVYPSFYWVQIVSHEI